VELFIPKKFEMTRIVAGLLKNRVIRHRNQLDFRPTQEKIRNALFNILGDLTDKTVADLYAGTGSLGFEALSRGARHCTFVEADKQTAAQIQENIVTLKLSEQATVLGIDVLKFLSSRPRFDLLLADPPYDFPAYESLFQQLDQLDSGVTTVIETSQRFTTPDFFLPWLKDVRQFGETRLNFYRK